MEGDADDSDDGHGETNCRGRHPEAAGKVERKDLRTVGGRFGSCRVEARGGEKDEPEVLECAVVEVEQAVCEKGAEHVSGPETA